ncbi:MAG TPA: DUF4349 domain-containing protein [Marmoricola sp.]
MTINSHRRHLGIAGLTAAAALTVSGLTGCSQGSGSDSAASAGSAAGARSSTSSDFAAKTDSLAPGAHAAQARSAAAPKSLSSTAIKRQVISTGDISLASTDVERTRSDIMHAISGWHGWIANEETSADDRGRVKHVWLTLRIPSTRFDAAMSGVAGLAHATHESRTSKDVTTQVIDTDARVRAKKAAVTQLERLLDRATTLGQVIRLEGDISDRQAELDSLKHQQAYLKDQTSLATITVDVTRATTTSTTAHHTGLWAGLRSGGHAFVVATVATLTAVGAVAPFAALIVVIGIPVWLIRRRRGRPQRAA